MEVVQRVAVPEPRYKLRWRFDFVNKPTKKGVFNANAPAHEEAWQVNKEGLARACIEGEDIYTHEEKILVEVSGQDYAGFEWVGYSRLRGVLKNSLPGEIKPRLFIGGATLFSREHKITVYVDGTYTVDHLTDQEKLFQKKEHSI